MAIVDMTKCQIAKSGNIITPKGRLSYAQFLIEGKEKTYEDSGKTVTSYTLNLLLPKDSDLTDLKKAMGKLALEKCDGDKKRAANFVEKRFLDPNNLPQGGKPAGEQFEGWVLIRASSEHKPKFAFPNGTQIPDEEVKKELYSGRWARATLNVYWTSNKKNPGVCIGLVNVQLLDHDENLGRAMPDPADEFGDASGDGNTKGDAVDDMFS